MATMRMRFRSARPGPSERLASLAFEQLPVAAGVAAAKGGSLVLNRRGRASPRIEAAAARALQPAVDRALLGKTFTGVPVDLGSGDALLVSGAPILDDDANVEAAVLTMPDVAGDERGGLERAMVRNARHAMLLVRAADGRIAMANAAAERMFGYDPGELEGRHISVVIAPTDAAPAGRAAEMVEALARDRWHGDVHNVRKDGSAFWSETDVVAVHEPGVGQLWLASYTEMTVRKDADDGLRAAEERYRNLFVEAPTGIALTDAEMRITDANSAFCEIIGQAQADLLGVHVGSFIDSGDETRNTEMWRNASNGGPARYRLETRLAGRSADARPIALSASIARDLRGSIRHGIVVIDDLQSP